MMRINVEPSEWESKAALLTHLDDAPGRVVLIGKEAEAPRKFFSLSIPSREGDEIGVISSGLGTKPAVAVMCTGRLFVCGHDTSITWIDADEMTIISSRRLDGVFYEFIPLDSDEQVLVIHELGALRIGGDGSDVWAVSTDVVQEATLDGEGNVVLTVMDQPHQVAIQIGSGATSLK